MFAHNPAAAEALAGVLARGKRPAVAILGVLDDKDLDAIVIAVGGPCRPVGRGFAADSPRALAVSELSRRVANLTDKPCLTATDFRYGD